MLEIDRQSKEQMHHQLYRQLRAEIETGVRQPGQKLASTRYLAQHLAVSRNTVDHAYQNLVAEGYLVSKPGSGYHVAHHLPTLSAEITELSPNIHAKFQYDFTEDYDQLQLFPKAAWLQAEQAVMTTGLSHIQPVHGDRQYRQQLTQYLARLKGIQASVEQIVVTSGFNAAAEIIANLIPDLRNQNLAVAEPIAPNARAVWGRLGIATRNFQQFTDLPRALGYVFAPTHNFPDGQGLTSAQRKKLATWLDERKRYCIELDTDGTLIYDQRPAKAIYHELKGQRSFYYSNYDDTLGSALCMGVLVLPKALVSDYQAKYGRFPNRNSQWQQQVLSRMIANDTLERYIRQLTIVYRNRRRLFVQTLKTHFGQKIEILGANAGTFLVVQFHTQQSISTLIAQAAQAGIGVVDPNLCWQNEVNPNQTVVFSFRQTDDATIVAGVQALAKVWHHAL